MNTESLENFNADLNNLFNCIAGNKEIITGKDYEIFNVVRELLLTKHNITWEEYINWSECMENEQYLY